MNEQTVTPSELSPAELRALCDAAEGGESWRTFGKLQAWLAVPENRARNDARNELMRLGFYGLDEGHNSGILRARAYADLQEELAIWKRVGEQWFGPEGCDVAIVDKGIQDLLAEVRMGLAKQGELALLNTGEKAIGGEG